MISPFFSAPGNVLDWAYAVAGIKYSYAAHLRDTGTYGFLLPEEWIRPTGEETAALVEYLATFISKDPKVCNCPPRIHISADESRLCDNLLLNLNCISTSESYVLSKQLLENVFSSIFATLSFRTQAERPMVRPILEPSPFPCAPVFPLGRRMICVGRAQKLEPPPQTSFAF
jgi:hypothetical protein